MKRCSNVLLSRLSDDSYLGPYLRAIHERKVAAEELEKTLMSSCVSLADFASGHEYFGLHREGGGWVFREWAPNASSVYMVGQFSDWKDTEQYKLCKIHVNGTWELRLPQDALCHNDLYRLKVVWPGGEGDRIPAYARRVVQDDFTKIFNAQVWAPSAQYVWKHDFTVPDEPLIIYESHVGMAQEKECVGTYDEFRVNILPRIARAGYNTVQLMGIMEHPYYGSFGYHVANFFAASSRFGTPEEFKALVDEAHGLGLAVIMDLVHSHAVKNEVEGLSRFDGTSYQYFHDGPRGTHEAWDSRCFNYGKNEVLHFLLSNCRYWLDEYHVDGYRFDGITSMLYLHHGLGTSFDSYSSYFDGSVDKPSISYLTLANKIIHMVRSDAVTIAEDVSGMPGLAAPIEDGGCGFDYRLAMGVPDCWFKLVNDVPDEDWDMNYLWHELTNRRCDEKTISYAECHDQALVGGKTLIFELIESDIYEHMHISRNSLSVARGVALHKMIRLATLATAGHGYLNFMGNEFGHPEWIDFPREGNSWSYHYARRQWSLLDNVDLKYHYLGEFDRVMMGLMAGESVLSGTLPMLLLLRNDDKVVIFERGGYFFFFNFHPANSYSDYRVEVIPGEYDLVFDTDEQRFAGHSRIESGQVYRAMPIKEGNGLKYILQIYLPCRTALVLRRR